ncbi:hypothetical protein MWU52_13100 [Jannaschia sp. S6380]|uniref:hypothetical protein n=1 Tax=Jannaschia sp. S6380 TaxID=2926408 RepID=UPI001FF63677|nr:hypothetical protein [Jannaschia sp. S6380]MCK0168496.1 hypothetical protein [Jannaschia sp. S6380]
MPNTLAHIGIQAVITRGTIAAAPPGWIWLGCILPDLPWIGLRLLRALPVAPPVHDARLWAVVASSLPFCLLAAGALACLSRRPARIFAILGLGAALHLILDATQAKWGNGAILWAPFDWRPVSLAFYWPEDPTTLVLSLLGLAVFAWAVAFWRKPARLAGGRRRPLLAGVLALLCGVGIVVAMPLAERADPHGIATLRGTDTRAGRCIAFDRARVGPDADGRTVLHVWTGEALRIADGALPDPPATISVQACFTTADTVRIRAAHVHVGGWRDRMSYVGLALIGLWWAAVGYGRLRHRRFTTARRSGGPGRRP